MATERFDVEDFLLATFSKLDKDIEFEDNDILIDIFDRATSKFPDVLYELKKDSRYGDSPNLVFYLKQLDNGGMLAQHNAELHLYGTTPKIRGEKVSTIVKSLPESVQSLSENVASEISKAFIKVA